MEALVLGRPSPEREHVVRELGPVGSVHVCQDQTWGCAELVDGCPLDHHDVDVAVVVADQLGAVEPAGVACAHRARIPVLAVGCDIDEPAAAHATKRIGFGDDVVAAAAEAAADASAYVDAVELALSTHLASGESVEVRAERTPRSVVITLVADLDDRRAGTLADRARDAVRRYDTRVAVIDVKVVPTAAG